MDPGYNMPLYIDVSTLFLYVADEAQGVEEYIIILYLTQSVFSSLASYFTHQYGDPQKKTQTLTCAYISPMWQLSRMECKTFDSYATVCCIAG
jgi:hypothetical protein